MKKIIQLVFFLFFGIFAQAQSKNATQETYYTCVMHPEIHEKKPGKCPKCGMALVKEKVKTTKKAIVKKPIVVKKTVTTPKKRSYFTYKRNTKN